MVGWENRGENAPSASAAENKFLIFTHPASAAEKEMLIFYDNCGARGYN
jgi:hypothetical protein